MDKEYREAYLKKTHQNIPKIPSNAYLVDTHCHLDMGAYKGDLAEVLNRSLQHNIKYIITIGIDLSSSKRAAELAQKSDMLYATVGVHPHDVDNTNRKTYSSLVEIVESASAKIVGYGEIGLDYVKKYSSVEEQRKQFQYQLSLGQELNLPVIIHNREADEDMLTILKNAAPFPRGGVMHCFSGDVDFAKKVLDLGLHISIPGIVTYKNAHTLKEVVRELPLSTMLLETDGPFLSPTPYRGKRNEPFYILYTAEEVARIRDTSLENICLHTTKNAIQLFKLPPIKLMENI